MADPFDVAARLAEGAAAVERAGLYVWACHELGYQHPDLTTHAAQIRDWYAQEDGLDLRALNADCAALSAAANAADEAVGRQQALTVDLVGVWSGRGADAAREFLWRHGQAAAAVRDALRHAADAMTALRDELWRAVDTKVAAVQDVDDRRLAQRGEWVAAAQTVTAGAGDRATASEIVDQQIKPFVDNDIRSDWLAAIHTATASVTAAYDTAIARLGVGPVAAFEVPGDLGPSIELPEETRTVVATAPAGTSMVPSMVGGTPPIAISDPTPSPVGVLPAAAPPVAPSAAMEAPAAPPAPPMASPDGLGGGIPSVGTGMSGFGQQLADMIGGLLGSSEDALSGADGIDPPDATDEAPQDDPPVDEEEGDDEAEDDEKDDEAEDDEDEKGDEEEAADQEHDDVESDQDDEAPPEEDLEAEPLPEPVPMQVPPPPVEPEPPLPPDEKTPCEIAADELPQVGE